jgi:hypothetical protein
MLGIIYLWLMKMKEFILEHHQSPPERTKKKALKIGVLAIKIVPPTAAHTPLPRVHLAR